MLFFHVPGTGCYSVGRENSAEFNVVVNQAWYFVSVVSFVFFSLRLGAEISFFFCLPPSCLCNPRERSLSFGFPSRARNQGDSRALKAAHSPLVSRGLKCDARECSWGPRTHNEVATHSVDVCRDWPCLADSPQVTYWVNRGVGALSGLRLVPIVRTPLN